MDLKKYIREIPDFPKEGILFRDISPILIDPLRLEFVAQAFVKDIVRHYTFKNIASV